MALSAGGAWAGVVADRSNKRNLLFVTQTLEMVQSFALGALAFMHNAPLPAFFGVAIAGGCLLAVDNPVRRSFVNEMVAAEDVTRGKPAPDGYLLSDKSSTIARLDDLPAGGGTAALRNAWPLGDLDGKPEGLAFTAQGHAIVGLDTRKARRNLVLLRLLDLLLVGAEDGAAPLRVGVGRSRGRVGVLRGSGSRGKAERRREDCGQQSFHLVLLLGEVRWRSHALSAGEFTRLGSGFHHTRPVKTSAPNATRQSQKAFTSRSN